MDEEKLYEPSEQELERLSRMFAAKHGSQFQMHRDGQTLTVAAVAGYGSWGNSPEKFADVRWREYKGIARFHYREIEKLKDAHRPQSSGE
jgi:hypothetical protein